MASLRGRKRNEEEEEDGRAMGREDVTQFYPKQQKSPG